MIPIDSPMIVWARDARAAREMERADWRLRWLVRLLGEVAAEYEVQVVVGSIERTVDETRAIYLASGREPPRGPGVHDVRPCRGADCVPREAIEDALGRSIAHRVSALAQYPRGYRSVIWHAVQGGNHWHCQVPYDALRLVADGRRRQSVAGEMEA